MKARNLPPEIPSINKQTMSRTQIIISSLIISGFMTLFSAASYAISAPEKFKVAVTAALCGPEVKKLGLNGHHFNVKPATVGRDDEGKPIVVSGQISHHLRFRRDDQLYYHIDYDNGKPKTPQIFINRGGWAAIIDIMVDYLTIVEVDDFFGVSLNPEKIPEIARELGQMVDGHWESQAQVVVALIAMAAQNQNFCF